MIEVITHDRDDWVDDKTAFVYNLKHPIKSWITDLEEGALQQAKNIANLPFLFKWMAWMADGHEGYGAPIGAVIATKKVVIPNAVGVDIGCGMRAFCLGRAADFVTTSQLKRVMSKIRKDVPMGFNRRKKPVPFECLPVVVEDTHKIIASHGDDNLRRQLGTLGGGNHFIEIQMDQEGSYWAMVHSGSRNIGLRVANYYNKVAKKLNEMWYSSVPKDQDLAFLPIWRDRIHVPEAFSYMKEMEWCVEFAKVNRMLMMEVIVTAFMSEVEVVPYTGMNPNQYIDVAHNYAAIENHYGENVVVHRKGATSAKAEEWVVIPGSQGTKSYIGKGLGNPESFMSCSHGAGRKMGRKAAKRELNLAEQQAILDNQGIVHGIRSEKELDEAPGAYKDITTVMENQKDLVEVKFELTPQAVIKA
jgi:tRNA-splicing ligase RtcB